MASNKLSALSAVSGSLTSDSLVYIADTQDSGSSYASKKITVANLLSDVAWGLADPETYEELLSLAEEGAIDVVVMGLFPFHRVTL